jgi:hypothetical protein
MRRAFCRTERQRDANRRWRALNVFVSPSTQRLEQLTPKFYGPSRRGRSCFFRSITLPREDLLSGTARKMPLLGSGSDAEHVYGTDD